MKRASSQKSSRGSAKFSRLRLTSKGSSSSTKQTETISEYFAKTTQTKPEDLGINNLVSLDMEEEVSSINTRTNALQSEALECPYKDLLSEEFTPLLDTSLSDDRDFKTPKPVNKWFLKTKAGVSKAEKTTRKSSRTSSNTRQSVITSTLNDNFQGNDFDAEQLQMALAISKSMCDEAESHKTCEDNLVSCMSPYPSTQEKINGVKKTLEQFGFTSDKSKLNAANRRREAVKVPNKRKKSKFKYITPTLLHRSQEEREALITSKVSTILLENSETPHSSTESPTLDTQLVSEDIQDYQCFEKHIFTLNSSKDLGNLETFYVQSLGLPVSQNKCGSLLRDWTKIPGRDSSPIKTTESTQILTSKMSEAIASPTNSRKDCFKTIDSKQSTNILPSKICENLASPLRTENQRSIMSPDLFDSDDENTSHFSNLNVVPIMCFEKELHPNKYTTNPNDSLNSDIQENGFDGTSNPTPNSENGSEPKSPEVSQKKFTEYDGLEETFKASKPKKNRSTNTRNAYKEASEENERNSCGSIGSSENAENKNPPNQKELSKINNDVEIYDLTQSSGDEDDFNCNSVAKCNTFSDDSSEESFGSYLEKSQRSEIDYEAQERKLELYGSSLVETGDKLDEHQHTLEGGEKDKFVNDEAINETLGDVFELSSSSNSRDSAFETIGEISNSELVEKTPVNQVSIKEDSSCKIATGVTNTNIIRETSKFKFKPVKSCSESETAPNKLIFRRTKSYVDNDTSILEALDSISETRPKLDGFGLLSKTNLADVSFRTHFKQIKTSQNTKADRTKGTERTKTNFRRSNTIAYGTEELEITNAFGNDNMFNETERKRYSFSAMKDDSSAATDLNVTDYVKELLSKNRFSFEGSSLLDKQDSSETSENATSEPEQKLNSSEENVHFSQESGHLNDEELNYSSMYNSPYQQQNKTSKINYNNDLSFVLSSDDDETNNVRDDENVANKDICNYSDFHEDFPIEMDYHFNCAKRTSITPLQNPRVECLSKADTPNKKAACGKEVLNDSLDHILEIPQVLETIDKVKPGTSEGKTPESKFLIKSSDVTPMVDYDNMNTPKIRKELEKFGLKPVKRHRGVQILKHIYNTTHPIVHTDDVQISDEDERIAKKRKSNDFGKSKKKLDLNPPIGDENRNGKIEIVGDLLSELDTTENLIFERRRPAKIHSCRLPLQVAWHNFLSSHPEIRENILMYEPLHLEVIHNMLKEHGHKYHIQDILTFFDRKCITVRTNQLR